MVIIRLRDKTGEMYRMFDVEHIDIDMRDKRIYYRQSGAYEIGEWDSVYYEDYTFNNAGGSCFIDVWTRRNSYG